MTEKRFLTIRETARTGLISEHYLRLRVKQGSIPGISVGNKFLINYPALLEMLDEESRTSVVS